MDDVVASVEVVAERAGDVAGVGRRDGEEDEARAGADFGEIVRVHDAGGEGGLERAAGIEERRASVACGAGHGRRERDPPRPSADDGDPVTSHGATLSPSVGAHGVRESRRVSRPSVQPVLDAVANALLAAGHGWLSRWVRGSLGEQAKLGALRFEKGALHVADAKLTIGDGKIVVIERAVLTGVLGAVLGRDLDFYATLRVLESELGPIEMRGVVAGGRGGGEGQITIATKTSCVVLDGRIAASGGIGGMTARGTLSFHDAYEVGILRSAVRPHRTGGLDLDATLGGTLRAPSIAGCVESAKLLLRLGDDPALPTLAFEEIKGRIEIDAQRIAWHDVTARIYGGRVRTTGIVKLDVAPVEVRAKVELAEIRVEQISTKADGTPLLAGHVHGSLGVRGGVDYVEGALSGETTITLDDGEFLAVALAAPSLEKYGLPVPHPAATSPLTARVEYVERTFHVTDLSASVDGVVVEGAISVTVGGPIAGSSASISSSRTCRRASCSRCPRCSVRASPSRSSSRG